MIIPTLNRYKYLKDVLKDFEKIVLQFHNSHSSDELKKIQQSNRKLWEEQLTLGGFFITICCKTSNITFLKSNYSVIL